MKFCPKCGSLLKPKEKKGKKLLVCSCGYTNKKAKIESMKEKIKQEEGMDVIDEDNVSLPKTETECPECGHEEAYYWLQQTRAGDEPETKFLKCTECKNVWRE